MQKCAFGHMWTARPRSTQSDQTLRCPKKDHLILQNITMESKCLDETAHVQDVVNLQISHVQDVVNLQISHVQDVVNLQISHVQDVVNLQISHVQDVVNLQILHMLEGTSSA